LRPIRGPGFSFGGIRVDNGFAVKKLRLGRRAQRELPSSPLELALYPAIADGRWQVPDRFNFTRDVVEALAHDPKRQAVMVLGSDGVIEPRTFLQLAERSARWSSLLRERGVRPGDRVLVLVGSSIDWLEVVLACLKVGAVVVPASVSMSAATLEDRLTTTDARLLVAARVAQTEVVRMVDRPHVLYVDEAQPLLLGAPDKASTHDSSSRDLAFVLTSAGTSGGPHLVAHTNAAAFAARVASEHWLDAGRGDSVWCTAPAGSPNSVMHALLGPWSRGAETLLHEGEFEPLERLDLIYRFGTTILNQTPAEYAAMAQQPELRRFRPPQLRRLVSTGDYLDPEVNAVFEETWGLVIHDGYSQAETNVFVGNGADAGFKPGSLGLPLPGHQVAVVDDAGNEVPPGAEGELAVRGRTPTLFAGYWEAPDETKESYRGDWYVTGDIATADADGFLWFLGRAADMLTSQGERFSPYASERALYQHDAITSSAVVGVRDLERGGQFLRAFVVLAPGVEGSDGFEAELRQDVGQLLAEHEVPREIEFVDELPTTLGGKVRRLELRERLVVGRSLWELPPPTELEPGFLEPVEAKPTWDNAVGGWTVPGAEAERAAGPAETDGLPGYVVAPSPEPVPETPVAYFKAFEPAPVVELPPKPETVVEFRPEPEPEPAVRAAPEPEPVAEAAPKLAPLADPEPEVAEPPEPEPVEAEAEAEAAPAVAPTPEPEPEPVVDLVPRSEPAHERVVEPISVTEPAPEPEPEPEPAPEPAPEPTPEPIPIAAFEPNHVPEFGEEPAVAPEPAAASALEPEQELESVAEREPLPDFVVDPKTTPTPVAKAPPPLSALEPEPDPGPLPDYVVDPERPREQIQKKPLPRPAPLLGVDAETSADPDPAVPSIVGLGLPPLAAFPTLVKDKAQDEEQDSERAPRPRRPRPAPAPPSSRKGRRERSAEDPGDEPEAVSWMDGLSSRLRAYSLADEEASAASSQDGRTDPGGAKAEGKTQDEEVV